jgi:hypothetical protein
MAEGTETRMSGSTDATRPMHAYEIATIDGDVLFYAAQTQDDALAAYDDDWSEPLQSIKQIPDDELDMRTLVVMDENEEPTEETATFREYINDEMCGECTAFQIGEGR